MPVKITSTTFYDEFTSIGGGGVPYLAGPVLAKRRMIMDLYIYWATENKALRFAAATKTITRGPLTLWTGASRPLNLYDNGSFITDGYRPGDTVVITGTASNNGTYTITGVIDTELTVSQTLINEDALNTYIYGTNAITAMNHFYGLIENGSPDDFHSLTDRDTIQVFSAKGLDANDLVTVTTMNPASSSKAWVNGSCTVVGMGITAHKQYFRITHDFYITPVYRAGQLTNLENGVPPAPEYFGDRKSLKYLPRVEAKYTFLDPDAPHSSERLRANIGLANASQIYRSGNTGWLDEFLNGEDPEYTLENIAIYNNKGASVTSIPLNSGDGAALGKPGVNLQGAVIITFRSANARFAAGHKMVLNHQWLPLDEEEYMDQATKQFMDCFKWDRVMLTEGAVPVNGDNYGTDKQVIYQAELNMSDGEISSITYYIQMSAAMLADLRARTSNDLHYLISAEAQDPAVTTTVATDANAIKCSVESYSYDTDDDSLFSVPRGTWYYRWPDEVTNYKTSGYYITGERAFTRTQFYVQWGARLNSLKVQIEAVNFTTDEMFPLLSRSWNLAENTFTNGITQVDIDEFQGYPGEANEPSNRVRCKNMPALNTGSMAGYELGFGFRAGYEWWQPLAGVNSIFPKGSNDWSEYSEVNGWTLRMRVYASVEGQDGVITDFKHTSILKVKGGNWVINSDPSKFPVNVEIQTYTADGLTRLEGNAILTEANTLVRAVVTGNFLAFPSGNFFAGYIILGKLNGGGRYEDRVIGTQGAETELDSPWIPTDETEKYANMDTTIGGPIGAQFISQVVISALLDYNRIDANEKYTLAGYFGTVEPQRLILQENGWPLLKEDGGGLKRE